MNRTSSIKILKVFIITTIAYIALLLAILLSATLFKNLIFKKYTLAIMILFGIVAFIPFLVAWIRKSFAPLEPIYLWIILYVFLYLANPIVQIIRGNAFSAGDTYLNAALLAAIGGLVCFYIGYYCGMGRKIASWIPVIKTKLSSKKLFYWAWSLIIVGFLGFNYFINLSGGWLIFWQKPHGLAGATLKTTAYLYQLPELMIIGFILMYEVFIYKIIIEKKPATIIGIINLIAAALGGFGLYAVFMGNRAYISWILIALVILYFLKKQSRPKLRIIIVSIIVLFLVLSAVPFFRGYAHIGSDLSKMVNSANFKEIITDPFNATNEFNSYLSEVSLVPRSIPYNYFSSYLKILTHPIPRLFWPSKPSLLNSNWNDFLSKSGLPKGSAETLLGDFYAQLGVWGIIIGTFFSGILWKTFWEYLKRAPVNRSVVILYAIIMPNMVTYLAQSAFIGFLKWFPYMIPITIIVLILSREIEKNS